MWIGESEKNRMAGNYLVPGMVLQGRYKIDSLISTAGAGHVYKASDARFPGKWWAIKAYSGLGKRTLEEGAKPLLRLNHPYAVKAADFFEEREFGCIVLEYVSDRTLEQVLESGSPVSESQLLSWGIQCAEALAYFAESLSDYTHYPRLSPGKILVTGTGMLRVIPPMSISVPAEGELEFAGEARVGDDVAELGGILKKFLAAGHIVATPSALSDLEQIVETAIEPKLESGYAGLAEFRLVLLERLKDALRAHPARPRPSRAMKGGIFWALAALFAVSILLWMHFFF